MPRQVHIEFERAPILSWVGYHRLGKPAKPDCHLARRKR